MCSAEAAEEWDKAAAQEEWSELKATNAPSQFNHFFVALAAIEKCSEMREAKNQKWVCQINDC